MNKNVDMDLEIAKLLKQEKETLRNQDDDKSQKTNESKSDKVKADKMNLEELPTQEEVNKFVEEGLLEYDAKTFKFVRKNFFNSKISFMFPDEMLNLEVDREDIGSLTYTNFNEEINCILSFTEVVSTMDPVQIKENALLNFGKAKVKTKCPEEGVKRVGNTKVTYCIIENKIPGQNIFNLMFFVEVEGGYVIVNFNGFTERYYKLWTMIYKAIINTIEV